MFAAGSSGKATFYKSREYYWSRWRISGSFEFQFWQLVLQLIIPKATNYSHSEGTMSQHSQAVLGPFIGFTYYWNGTPRGFFVE